MQFGGQQNNFYVNDPRGVAQVVETRLALFLGEFFLDTSDGTDWNGKVFGKYTSATRDLEIKQRILGTPGVTGISAYSGTLNTTTRQFTVTATIDTTYGPATVTSGI